MSRNKSVLIITPGFPKDETDDTCIPPLQELLIEFRNSFPEIKFFVIALQYPFEKKKYFWNDIAVYSCGGRNKKFPLRFFSWIKALLFFKEIKQKNRISLIHSFWFGEAAFLGNIFSYPAVAGFKIPHLNTLMGQEVFKENKYLTLIPGEKIKIIAISKKQQNIFQKNSNKQIFNVIPFGIAAGNHCAENDNFEEREIDILGAGSLIELKNYKLFINIVKKLVDDNPNLNCVLIGDGKQTNFLVKLAKEFKIENNLRFTGKLPRKKVFDFMKRSKILLHPSKYESLGYVYEEALMFGLTIVSFETGIAEPSEKWKVCETEEEIYDNLKYLLNNNLDFTPFIPYKIEKTACEYFEIYNIFEVN